MAMMLPDELAWLLEMLGFDWPTANEDHMMQAAQTWREFGAQVGDIQSDAMRSAGNVTSDNYGESIDAFVEKWDKFSGGSGYLDDARQAAEVIASVFDVAAMLIIGMKIAVIIQLIVLAVQIAVAAATAVVTFGISAAASAAMTQVTRIAVRKILKEAAQALLEAALEAVKEPFVSALEEMSKDLVAQTVNQNFGAQDGYNLGRTADAGKTAVKDGFDNFGQTLGESLRDGAGSRAGSHARGGLDSAAGNGSSSDAGADAGAGAGTGSGSGAGSGAGSGSGSGAGAGGSSGSGSGAGAGAGSGGTASGGSGSGSGSGGSGAGSGAGADTSGGGAGSGSSGSGGDGGRATAGSSTSGGTGDTGGSGSTSNGSTGVGTQAGSNGDSGSTSSPTPAPAPTPSSDRPLTPFDAGYNEQQSASGSAASPSSTPDAAPSSGTPDVSTGTDAQRNGSSETPAPAAQSAPSSAVPHARVEADVTTPSPAPTSTPDTAPPVGQPDPSQVINTASESAAPVQESTNSAVQTPSPDRGNDLSTATDPRTQVQQPTATAMPAGTPTPTDTSSSTPTSTSTTPGSIPGAGAGAHTGSDSPSRTSSSPTFHSQSATATEAHTPTRPSPTANPTPTGDQNSTTPTPNQTPNVAPTAAPGPITNTPTTPAQGPSRQPDPTTNPRTDTPRTETPQRRTPTSTPTHTEPTSPSTRHPNTPTNNRPGTTNSNPNTPNQPSLSSTPTPNQPSNQAPSQTPSSAPNQPTNQVPGQTPNQPANQVPVQVPIQTPNNNPSAQHPSSNGHPAQNSPDSTPPKQEQPAPLSQGQSLRQIRDSLNHAPYGLLTPDPAHQQALANAVPRNEDGTPQRHPDPNGEWAQLQNDGGLSQPGRSNNCLDNARAGLSTWFGDPQVSAPRTPDKNQDGSLDTMSPERDSYNNLDAWAGRPQIWAGADHPNPYGRIAHHLQEAGPGSAAVVGVQWPGGGGHAFNVYNHNGQIIWVDHQTGEVSPNPIHTGAAGVRYVPFDPNGQTMDAPWEKKQDTEPEASDATDSSNSPNTSSSADEETTSGNGDHSGYGSAPQHAAVPADTHSNVSGSSPRRAKQEPASTPRSAPARSTPLTSSLDDTTSTPRSSSESTPTPPLDAGADDTGVPATERSSRDEMTTSHSSATPSESRADDASASTSSTGGPTLHAGTDLTQIHDGLRHSPGGLQDRDPADQRALEQAVPRDPDGTPQRHPDPTLPWLDVLNDGGMDVPGRSNNCPDNTRAFLETWYGNPQVAAARTVDVRPDGTLDLYSPEDRANQNIAEWAGAPHTYAGTPPTSYDRIADDLLRAGHGSAAVVQVNWDHGGGHAYNAVNYHGRIIWVDTQSKEASETPINTQGAGDMFYIPLGPDRQPLHPQPDDSTPHTSTAPPPDPDGERPAAAEPTGAPEDHPHRDPAEDGFLHDPPDKVPARFGPEAQQRIGSTEQGWSDSDLSRMVEHARADDDFFKEYAVPDSAAARHEGGDRFRGEKTANYAAFKFKLDPSSDNKEYVVLARSYGTSGPMKALPGQPHTSKAKHSERTAIQYLAHLNQQLEPGQSIRVTEVYTERAPCPNCAAYMYRTIGKVQTMHSVDYPVSATDEAIFNDHIDDVMNNVDHFKQDQSHSAYENGAVLLSDLLSANGAVD
ncbi:toxin glutamine deamidase domain-containing protein [Streptomyces sp. NPDC059897]|uniref:toxin glutamine deamidase domain-containing protein n=1 Tax=Streptomyces sp. NPDC059897 TaxID=3346994 RepID=UPI00365B3FEE